MTEEQLAEYEARRSNPGAPSAADAPFHAPPDVEPEPITINLVGDPQGKGRARSFMYRKKTTGQMAIGHHTPEKTATYEGMIRTVAMQEIGNKAPFDCPVEFVMRAIFPVPASWSTKKRQRALTGEIKPGKKPDLDNIAKAWNDALNGVVYRDDSLICRMTLDKRYGPQALVVVTVRAIP